MIDRIKSKIHALIFWQTSAGDFFNQMYGLRVFYRNSFAKTKFRSKKSLRAFLIKQYHIVEKGLSLPEPRLAFGRPKIQLLMDKCSLYVEKYGEDDLTETIKACLLEYVDFNKKNEVDITDDFFKRVINFSKNARDVRKQGGTIDVSKSELEIKTAIDFESFVKSRFSIRDFDTKELEISKIQKAVEIAKYAPSVCNRQSWAAHVFTKKEEILELLRIQGGSNGFTESINKLVIITTDTRSFTTLESNQVFVDGGLFAMNLVLALHSQGIGGCCLNTCFPYTMEKKVKKIGGIPKNERLIMMMGIGNLKESYKVAISKKKDIDEVLFVH